MLRAELQTLAGAGAQSLTTGTHFDALQVLGGNLDSVIGNAVVSGMVSLDYLDEYTKTIDELSIEGLLSDYQTSTQEFNNYREQQLIEERNVPVSSYGGYNSDYCAIPVEDNNYTPIPEGFYDNTALTQLSEAAGTIWEDYGDEILRYGPKALGVWGSRSPASETGTSLTPSDYLKMAGSMALDFIPIVGQLKAAEEVWSGKELFSGERINRGLAALGLVPGGKLAYTALKGLGKTGSKVELLVSKTAVVEEIAQTVPNKFSPSVVAKGFQGSRDYPGIDKYRDITLKKGTIVYAGEPGVTGFFTTSSAIRRSKLDATALFECLQVSPRNGLYRPSVTAFEIIEDTLAAFGITRANPKYGVG